MSSPTSLSAAPEITITINGEQLAGWEGLSVVRSIDSAADAFSFSLPWNPSAENRTRFRPFATPIVKIEADGALILRGYVEQVNAATDSGKRQLNIQGRSETGVLVDWSAGPPFEFEGVSFNDIAAKVAHPYTVVAPVDVDVSKQGTIDANTQSALDVVGYGSFALPVIDVEIGQTVFEFLSQLAAANGLWARPATVTNGSILQFVRLNPNRASVADLLEGQSPVLTVAVSHDVTKRFSTYTAISQQDGEQQEATVSDPLTLGRNIRGTRIVELKQRTTDITQAAIRARSQAIIDSYQPSCTVSGWTHDGDYWRAGDIIRLQAPGAMVYEPSRLIIRRATFKLDEQQGQTTQLDLTLPEAYAQTQPEATPWAG